MDFPIRGSAVARLIVIKGADEGRQFELADGVTTIGRDRSNGICLHDTEVSRRHAEIAVRDSECLLRDVGSANGTVVNTKDIRNEVVLQPGDHLRVGQTILVYSPSRSEGVEGGDLADHIRLVTRSDADFSSAIVKTINENRGSQILARPDLAGTEWLRGQLANLATMYATIQAVSHILDLDQLLERIMELIFNSIEADHGCIMARNPETGVFEPKAVRYRDGVNRHEKIAISRTIMDHVLQQKQGVLITDAAKDERFASISAKQFNIREAICVPMKGRHETVGVLFLDTQTKVQEAVRAGREERSEEHTSEL